VRDLLFVEWQRACVNASWKERRNVNGAVRADAHCGLQSGARTSSLEQAAADRRGGGRLLAREAKRDSLMVSLAAVAVTQRRYQELMASSLSSL
jgi:hypothetical protein